MSRFNAPSVGTKTVNLAGGEAFSQTPELELVSLLLTSFAGDQAYRTAEGSFARLRELINQCNPKFVAQAAIYTRHEFGMRSISHVAASMLAAHVAGQPWAKSFFERVIKRPDDITEIISYHLSQKQKLSNSMKKGLGAAFAKFDAYTLAKYKGEGKAIKLVDAINLLHPEPTERNADAIKALMKGELKSTDTWEAKLSEAGQKATSEDEKLDLKKGAWTEVIVERKIGYFALLRNLRNIIEQAPDVLPQALEMLVDEGLIRKSLVLPFRYMTAYEEIAKLNLGSQSRTILIALDKAVEVSLKNVPKFEGETLVVCDVSGSMTMEAGGRPARIAALFTAVITKANNADAMFFAQDAMYAQYNPNDSVTSLMRAVPFNGGGTNFHSIFQRATRKYDRIIILSDMQGWIGGYSPASSFANYKKATGANPRVYSFDLAGNGTLQFPERNVFCLAGFSDKTMDLLTMLETDRNALVNTIKKIDL